MSVEANVETTEQHLAAEAGQDLQRLLATLADDALYEESLLDAPLRGKAAITAYYQDLWTAFPDFTYVVTNRVADEACVVYEMTVRGTHTGTFRGIPATGKTGNIKGVIVFPMKDGKALGERIYLDNLSLLTQLGILPRRESVLGRLMFALLRLRLCVASLFRRMGRA